MSAMSELALLCGLSMAVSIGMTAWRLVASTGKFKTQVDGVLGACLVVSGTLFLASLVPGGLLI